MKILAALVTLLFTANLFAGDMPKLDKKIAEGQRAEKCADWARGEVKGVSDKKNKVLNSKKSFSSV